MTLAAAPHAGSNPGDNSGGDFAGEFVVEDITTGLAASGFGHLGDGRSFAFHVHRGQLLVEVYRPRVAGPVPAPEDVVARASRNLVDLDVDDARSLSAAVRDAIAEAAPVPRPAR
jgi:hypothetical protein